MIIKRKKEFGLLGYLFRNGLDYFGWIELVEELEKNYPFSVDRDFKKRCLIEGDILRKQTKDNDEYSYDDLTAYVFYKIGNLSKNQSNIVIDNFKNLSQYVKEYISGKGVGDIKDYALYVVFLESINNCKEINLVFSFIGLKGSTKNRIFDYTIKLK